jgi:LuxR family transcriptional activator of conjugal transfer of Ti plasmids
MDVDLIAKLLACNSEEELKLKFKKMTSKIGIEKFAYISIPNDDVSLPTIISNYPESWVKHYVESNYLEIDPVIRICRVSSIPFTWSYARDLFPKTDQLDKYWSEANDYYLKEGVSLSIPNINGFSGFGFQLHNINNTNRWLAEHEKELKVLANLFYFKINSLTELSIDIELRNSITAREIECAQWISTGLTAGKIANKMKITERTVRYHLEQLKIKLNVKTKEEVIALLSHNKIINL